MWPTAARPGGARGVSEWAWELKLLKVCTDAQYGLAAGVGERGVVAKWAWQLKLRKLCKDTDREKEGGGGGERG